MKRRAPERIEVTCLTCGVIAELFRPRGASRPKLCDCPGPRRVTTATTPRRCIRCSTPLNRYNLGSECGPCLHTRTHGPRRR